ncbi:hypothetical protein Amal_03918 [Acetobacter malorum]|uniref:Uncharacterized protein n=1 Tax=Acetobacter malorum TaxID=178901 RepID=A0A177G5V8_9PROT|nr:hypothetical protein Amal_03918 [Acetobacter malorum]
MLNGCNQRGQAKPDSILTGMFPGAPVSQVSRGLFPGLQGFRHGIRPCRLAVFDQRQRV